MKRNHPFRQFFCIASAVAATLLGLGAVHAGVIPVSERAVLTAIYNSTNGPTWFRTFNWINTPPENDPDDVDECVWWGITCDQDVLGGPTPHVIAINLNNNYLAGSLPALDGLPFLVSIDVSHNQGVIQSAGPLTGPIPPLSGLIHLQTFRGNFNQFTSIPSLSGLTDLLDFDVSDNHLGGPLPTLSGLLNLKTFTASNLTYPNAGTNGNHLTGSIPPLAGLINLQAFSVNGNQLSGPIPSLTGLVNLQGIVVSNNNLSGTIPSLAGLPSLGGLLASNNQLSGSIPVLDGVPNLTTLDVSHNQLSGSIPAIAGHMQLSIFHVEYNQLTGSLPAFTNIDFLQGFYADHNLLTGTLPVLTSAFDLLELNVSYNKLNGTLPALHITALNSMVAIHLDHNQFSGALPAPPSFLVAGWSTICPNLFTLSTSTAWNSATGFTPWWATPFPNSGCDGVFNSSFDLL